MLDGENIFTIPWQSQTNGCMDNQLNGCQCKVKSNSAVYDNHDFHWWNNEIIQLEGMFQSVE